MAKTKASKAPQQKTQKAVEQSPAEPEGTRKQRIEKILKQLEDRLVKDAGKASVAEFLKLAQLARELEEDEHQVKELRVSWVDRTGTSSIAR
jgi:hypothetical protein